jgi:hypothetical protein
MIANARRYLDIPYVKVGQYVCCCVAKPVAWTTLRRIRVCSSAYLAADKIEKMRIALDSLARASITKEEIVPTPKYT